ncbi:glycosyltransferase family 2 protein [Sphingobacterium oryzagri]|uniref:Glycosyltransferase family 2 protein n=1 Tax=Sphingobacterium oryzagri TaxID=3025669 RepID=A0ABY7WIS3_9SPHI|nr:glycosyltransferase family 2 protein [Sphingobacterium sp. KACC 22765]WDF69517.1 glycosyltransferase family 2 protein [Sphingobacterium sp. KACC 22765]
MSKTPLLSLVISTYNWPQALRLCLDSVAAQTVMPDEIIIADDGSREDTRDLISLYQQKLSLPLVHVWHEDHGFRLSHIRNKAIAQATGEYIIQIDGDIILDKNFIKDHISIRQPGHLVVGSRAMLSEDYSKKLLEDGELPDLRVLRQHTRNTLNSTRLPWIAPLFAKRYKTRGRYRHYTRGCNMAFWKEAVVAVNGYNEDISGWGTEDSELVVRLLNAGQKKLFLKFAGLQYHIWHKVASRDRKEANELLLEETIRQSLKICTNGINKYLS